MKGAALEKELQMRKLFEEMNIKNAVEQEKMYWEKLAAQAGRAAHAPFPAPGFEIPKETMAKEDPLPDSWADAATAMGLAKTGATTAGQPIAAMPSERAPPAAAVPAAIPPAIQFAAEREDLGEPLRDPHPKEFAPPKDYSGGADTWMSWSESFKDYMTLKDSRWSKLLSLVEGMRRVPVTDEQEKKWDR